MLRLFHGRGKPLSSVQMARLLGLPVGTVAYHARVLWRFGALEAARERQLRGAIARFYDSTIEDDPPIEALLEETRELDDQEGGLLWDK